ncbi:MAG: hypothetical protein M3N07_10040 [Pseudomonadota bacterium]|nr:hypothetical protein [Pseudomonadota bacterium]
MSTRPILRARGARDIAGFTAAARPAALRSRPVSGRRPTHSPADRLRRLSTRLDLLLRDAEVGASSHREFERMCVEAEEIADGIRAVFRGETSPQPINPPLCHQGGKAWW